MAGADRSAVVSLIKELSDDSILQEARSCEDEEFLSFLLRRERQSPVHTGNYFERIKPLSVWCFRFLKSFLNVKSCSQLFGTFVSYLPGSASWTKEWGETYHWLTEASIDDHMDTWEPWKPAIRWPIDLTLQNRVYFVFIAEFVERLPTIFPANIWSTYLFETEHRWAKWLISDPSPKGTRWIYGAFLVSKFKTSYHTCYFSIQIFNPVIKNLELFHSNMISFYSDFQFFNQTSCDNSDTLFGYWSIHCFNSKQHFFDSVILFFYSNVQSFVLKMFFY